MRSIRELDRGSRRLELVPQPRSCSELLAQLDRLHAQWTRLSDSCYYADRQGAPPAGSDAWGCGSTFEQDALWGLVVRTGQQHRVKCCPPGSRHTVCLDPRWQP